jgi:electron transport complex protein RnfG
MKKLDKKEILFPTLSLFIICLVVTALLAGANAMTKDTIKAQDEANAQASRKVVLPEAQDFKPMEGDTDSYIGTDASGKTVGYVFATEEKGYGGTVRIMTGITQGGKVSGVTILSQNETPGLGANATKPDFLNQYNQNVPQDGFTVVKSKDKGDGKIDAMTGATITSKAVTGAVNDAVKKYNELKKKGSAN